MIITSHSEQAEIGQPFYRLLSSDLHLGSPNADHNEIVKQFQIAKDSGARILVNGDIFDCVGPLDKRFDLATLHPDVERKKDLAAAIVEMATDLLMPFRHSIDVAGLGNHEETWVKHTYNDPVRRLIENLNAEGGKIKHGSFWGYIQTTFIVPGHRKRARHKLLYLHGTGGDSPVTRGTIDINRKGRNWQFDCLTFGHKHNVLCTIDQIADVTPRNKYTERRQLSLQTGSYYRNYKQLSDETVLDQSYAARSSHPPKPTGGVFLCLRPEIDDNGDLGVKQDFFSDLVPPWRPKKKVATCSGEAQPST